MALLIVLLLGLSEVYSDFHSLRGYETAVSSPGSGLPEYSVVVYVDDKMIVNYTSDTGRYLPKVEWMKKLGAEYWEKEAKRSSIYQQIYRYHLQTLMRHFNQSRGLHVYQSMYGCELRDDGSTGIHVHQAYDGRDFLYLDTQSRMYIPVMNEAQITTQRLNSLGGGIGEVSKNYLDKECLEYLKLFIIFGRKELEKRVCPEVKVWGRQSAEVTKLYCLVYGFHPRAVDVKWMRNGTVHITSTEASPILPHPDGTYQIRLSVEVPTGEGDSYSCHVDHSSLEEPLVLLWDPSPEPTESSIVLGGALGSLAVVLSLAGIGYILYKRRSGTLY